MDLMPGLVTYFWFTPTRTGTFEIICAGFCGIGHAQMRGNVVVEEEGDYQTWLQKQRTFAQMSAPKTIKDLALSEAVAISGQRGSAR